MRQVKNILTALVAFVLVFSMAGAPVAFAEPQRSDAPDAVPAEATTTDQPTEASEQTAESPSVIEDADSTPSATATAATAADIEGFRATLTQAWYDMPEGNIDLSPYGLTLDEANEVWREVQYDNPVIFWDGDGYWHMCDGYVTGYENDWAYSKGDVDAMMAAYETKVAEALSWTSESMSNWEKAVALHDYLVRNCTYQYAAASDIDYSAYGILVNGTGRCAAYAKAYQDLLGRVGIEAEYVIGNANGGSHAWNHVKIDGSWYAVDVTYDDACYLINGSYVDVDDYSGVVTQKFLLKSDAYMEANGHQAERALYAATDAQFDYGHAWPTYNGPAPEEPLFNDVSATDWFVTDGTLDYVVGNGIMQGSDGAFRPYASITRAEFATILWRYANPTSAANANTAAARNVTGMGDVASGLYYTEAVNWCFQNGVITGVQTSTGTAFEPNRAVTREEAAVMLTRVMKLQGVDVAPTDDAIAAISSFADASACSSWAVPSLACAHANGIINGSGGCLRPHDSITRCEAAALLKRTAELLEG